MEPKYTLFYLFGQPVTLFSLCIALAVAAGLLLIRREQKKMGLRADTTEIFALLSIPLGLIGGRIVYCLVNFRLYLLDLGVAEVFRLWNGGYALLGIALGCALAAWLTARITRQSPAKVLDMIAAPSALMIALGRFAEWTSGQGTSQNEVEIAFFQRFPFAVFDAEWEIWFWAIFMLEGVTAWIIALLLQSKKAPASPGGKAKMLVILMCCTQILFEMFRRDALVLDPWFIRITQVGALALLVMVMLGALIRWKKLKKNQRMNSLKMLLNWLAFLICSGINIWMQFAVQKSADLPAWACYAIMGITCIAFGLIAYRVMFRYQIQKQAE